MLNSIPESAVANFQSSKTIGDWITEGTYVVTSCTRKEIIIEADYSGYGSVLLLECENLLNHCIEHIDEMICLRNDERIRSQAWAVVTAYYFGFFAASAFLRLVGRPISFLTTEQLRALQVLASAPQRPGQGAFGFSITRLVSLTRVEVSLRQSDKVHEATWKSALGLVDTLNQDPALTKTPAEALLYDSICSGVLFGRYKNFQWPSLVRISANYRPGFMYRLQRSPLSFSKLFDVWRDTTAADIHQKVQKCWRRCKADPENFTHHADLMLNVAIVVFLITRELYSDLLSRRKADRRWEDQRRNYIRCLNLAGNDYQSLLRAAC